VRPQGLRACPWVQRAIILEPGDQDVTRSAFPCLVIIDIGHGAEAAAVRRVIGIDVPLDKNLRDFGFRRPFSFFFFPLFPFDLLFLTPFSPTASELPVALLLSRSGLSCPRLSLSAAMPISTCRMSYIFSLLAPYGHQRERLAGISHTEYI